MSQKAGNISLLFIILGIYAYLLLYYPFNFNFEVEINDHYYLLFLSVIYSLVLVPVGILPYLNGMSGIVSFWIVLAANLFMVAQCVRLYREMNVKAARRVMFSSYIYLPIVLLALLCDKNFG